MTKQLHIEAQSINWVEVITNLITKTIKLQPGPKPVIPPVQITYNDTGAVFIIDPSFITPAALADAIGSTAEQVAGAEKITLRPTAKERDWQPATVDYFGHA